MREPLDHLFDTNYFHYALQLNIYRLIYETEYEIKVSALFLGIFHPARSEPTCVQLPFLDEEMRAIHRDQTMLADIIAALNVQVKHHQQNIAELNALMDEPTT